MGRLSKENLTDYGQVISVSICSVMQLYVFKKTGGELQT